MIPTIFHVTHWKAGSQWIYHILRKCLPDLIVPFDIDIERFISKPIQEGKIYPTVYLTKEQFDRLIMPPQWCRFIIIRDLRDTLVSAYFSLKFSHPVISPNITKYRKQLNAMNISEGLVFLLKTWLPKSAAIQESWLDSGEPLIHYEDILKNDLEIVEPLLIYKCHLPVQRNVLREAIIKSRYEFMTNGRKQGEEDVTSHYRKGIMGDWRNYFDDDVKKVFKDRYQYLLNKTGYEAHSNW